MYVPHMQNLYCYLQDSQHYFTTFRNVRVWKMFTVFKVVQETYHVFFLAAFNKKTVQSIKGEGRVGINL